MEKEIHVAWPVEYRVKLGLAREILSGIQDPFWPEAVKGRFGTALKELDIAIAFFDNEYGNKRKGAVIPKAKRKKKIRSKTRVAGKLT